VPAEPAPPAVHVATWDALTPRLAHDLVKLRLDVFVVEQDCPYPELDGRDVEPATEHVWTADDTGPTAYLRVLEDGAALRVGRVCTRKDARGDGLGARLMADVLRRHGDRALVLEAQSYLTGWYERFGFAGTGPEYLEDGIRHTPMRREPATD
jgi:ElaA protein